MKKRRRTKPRHIPQRTCVACRTTRPKRELIRIVRLVDGEIAVDETGKQNGRGAYLCRQRACWTLGLKQGSLNRALRVTLSPEDHAMLLAYAASLPERLDHQSEVEVKED